MLRALVFAGIGFASMLQRARHQAKAGVQGIAPLMQRASSRKSSPDSRGANTLNDLGFVVSELP